VSPRQGPRGSVWWALWLGVIAVVVVALGVGGYFGWERWRERVQAPSGEPGPITSIAVLPFADLAGDPEQEYFVDGMTEALITELSKISALRVISRTSVMQYKDVKKPLPEIARELNVDAVVEGSVLRAGDRVRITAQLVHAPTDTHLWAESYDRELRDILALHSEVARAIAREVKVTVTPEEETRLAAARAVNPEAHELYLRGRYHWHKRGREGLEKSLQYFQQAIEKDPGYARAYAGLADVYAVRPSWGFAAPTDDFPRARAAARKALELDENLAQPYATLGQVKDSYDRDWRGAEEDCRRALELDPNYATGHHWYGILLSTLGRHEEAIAELETAVRLDPLAPNISRWLGRVLYHARRYDEAVQQLQKTVEMHPDFSGAFLDLGTAYAQMGRYPEALAAMEKSRGLSEADPLYAYAGWIYARTGRKEEAQRLLRRLQELSGQQYVDSSAIAIIYIGLGRKEEALTWLERAYEERGAYRILYLKVDPVFDPLREEPRFQELLRRLNFPE
ncbi:MAG: tetratricopeptide repeat protein, partial [Terriglobia bacterium]